MLHTYIHTNSDSAKNRENEFEARLLRALAIILLLTFVSDHFILKFTVAIRSLSLSFSRVIPIDL